MVCGFQVEAEEDMYAYLTLSNNLLNSTVIILVRIISYTEYNTFLFIEVLISNPFMTCYTFNIEKSINLWIYS